MTNYFVSFLLWLVSTVLLILDIVYGRLLLMALFGFLDLNYWVLSFIDRAGVFILGTIALCLALYFEHYFRQGVANRQLWPRFARVGCGELAIILAGVAVSWFTA